MIAWVAVLVLSLGLPRLFVLCVGPHGGAHVEMVHASGACCAHGHVAAADEDAGLDRDGEIAGRQHGGCTDLSLALEPAPLPKARSIDLEQQPIAELAAAGVACDHGWPATDAGPPPTGPPRADRRTVLRASTVLRL